MQRDLFIVLVSYIYYSLRSVEDLSPWESFGNYSQEQILALWTLIAADPCCKKKK